MRWPLPWLLGACAALGCVTPFDTNGGSQIGSLECSDDVIEVQLRDPTGLGLSGELSYAYEAQEPITLQCTGYCMFLDPVPELGTYVFEATVAEQTQAQTLVFDDSYFVQDIPECDPYRYAVVLFEFDGE